MKLAHKISLSFLCVSVICLGIAFGFIYWSAESTLTYSIFENLVSNVHARTEHVETYLRMSKASLLQASRSIVLPNLLKTSPDDPAYKQRQQSASQLLRNKKQSAFDISEYMLLNALGRVIASSDQRRLGQDQSKNDYFLGAQKGVHIKDAYFSRIDQQPSMAISAPLFDDNSKTFLGVLVAMMKMDDLDSIMTERTGLGETGEVFIINKYGYMITPSRFRKDTFLKQKVDTLNARLALKDKSAHVVGEATKAVIYFNYCGVKTVGAHDYIPEMQWRIIASMDASEAFLPLKKMRGFFLWIFLLMGAMSWVLGQWIGQMISIPIRRLYKGTQIIGRGDLDYKVGFSGTDEVGQLSRAFDHMVANLKKSTASITTLNKEISERKQAEKNMNRSQEVLMSMLEDNNTMRQDLEKTALQLESILSSTQDAIVMMGPQGEISFWNSAAERIFGYTSTEVMGKNLHKLLVPVRYYEAHLAAFPRFIQNGQGAAVGKTLELEGIRKDGVEFPIELSLSAINFNNSWHAIGIMRDITERKRSQQELILSRDAAHAANKAKSEFLANMSHEIRTPLNAVLGFSHLLLSSQLNEKQRSYLTTITSSGELLLATINDILDFSKLEAGKIRLESLDFDLSNLVYDVFKMASIRFKDNKINAYVDWDASLPAWVKGDPTRLRQVLLNLLGNAAKFTDKGEIGLKVSLEHASKEETVVKFCVKDTGVGVPQDKKEALFNAFTQADSSITRKYGGTGLGLAISKKLVHAMGGKIWVESEEGSGSQFFFTVAFGPGTSLINQPIEPLSKAQLMAKTVLCIDDYPSSLEILSRYCQELGLTVIKCSSGQEALQKLNEGVSLGNMPDLILSDIMMPVMDGYSLAQKIRSNPKFDNIKIIAITSDARVGTCTIAQEKGFNAFLSKPVSPDDLVKTICTVFGDQRPASSPIITRHMADELCLKGLRILVADDSSANRQLMKAYLDICGCVTDFANDGQQAVEKVRSTSYHLCLMDLQMPVMDGCKASQIIRQEISKEIPIIALTAAVMKEDIERAREAGMNDFLTKPIDINKLKTALIKHARS
ncbi:MAG: response regulator [Candidatus Omnitrophica bacterium]|nr:response regulator [Candidatus Omnitrophota bacterium]